MRVCLEATSALGRRSGVGSTTVELVRALADSDDIELVLLDTSTGRREGIETSGSKSVETRPGGWLVNAATKLWWRTGWPPAEMFCGEVDVFHGPNYLLPPLRRAAGVVTIHDMSFARVPELCPAPVIKLGEAVRRFTARADRIIVPSMFAASEVKFFFPELADRVRVVPMGVRDLFFECIEDPRPDNPPTALFVGNLEARKGVDVLLDAFEIVRTSVRDAKLLLVGQPSFGWVRVGAEHAGSIEPGVVEVLGYLPDEDVACLLAGADVVVYPSRYEGFGLPPLEAMACRTPVVASDAPALREICGPHATYAPVGDAGALAEAMRAALTDAPDVAAVEAARAHAESFSWRSTAEATIDVYREAMAAR